MSRAVSWFSAQFSTVSAGFSVTLSVVSWLPEQSSDASEVFLERSSCVIWFLAQFSPVSAVLLLTESAVSWLPEQFSVSKAGFPVSRRDFSRFPEQSRMTRDFSQISERVSSRLSAQFSSFSPWQYRVSSSVSWLPEQFTFSRRERSIMASAVSSFWEQSSSTSDVSPLSDRAVS